MPLKIPKTKRIETPPASPGRKARFHAEIAPAEDRAARLVVPDLCPAACRNQVDPSYFSSRKLPVNMASIPEE